MSQKLWLRLASGLVLFTCAGHTAGTFMPIPVEQTQMLRTVEIMQRTLVPMPVGSAKSYMQILDGNNIATSLFLLTCGLILWSLGGAERSAATRRVLLIVALGLAGLSAISFMYFFPVPAVCVGLASLLTIAEWAKYNRLA